MKSFMPPDQGDRERSVRRCTGLGQGSGNLATESQGVHRAELTEEEQAKYLPAVSNVHELVAWGMSNQDFQEKVLEHVVMRSKTRQNKLITGMKAFIESVIGILFRDTNKTTRQVNETGMAVLLRNTAGLLNASGQTLEATGTSHAMANTSTAPTNYTTHQIYESLGSLSGFDGQHQVLLNNIVEKLHGPYGIYKTIMEKARAGHYSH